MLNHDLPIGKSSEDILNRKSFSKNLARVILEYSSPEAFSIGLYGKWGSGKTSVLNMILEEIETTASDVIILRFNPWLCSDSKQLIAQFFKQLASVIKLKKPASNRIWELIDNYADAFELSEAIPIAGNILTIIAKVLGKHAKTHMDDKNGDLQNIKDQIIKQLSEAQEKIIVTIDDIDRLSEDEIISVFQLVKSLADFPYTMYLLAFDYDVVVNALKKVQSGDGAEYLEKVVQVPFLLPAPNIDDIYNVLFSKLNSILSDLPEEKWDKVGWNEIFQFGIKHYIASIRDIIRYTNVFSLNFELLKDETDSVDLLGLTCLQVFEPNVYSRLPFYKNDLCGDIPSVSSQYHDIVENCKKILESLISVASNANKDATKELLKFLFPKLNAAESPLSGFGRQYNGYRFLLNNNLAHLECFNKYFTLTLDNDAIPTAIVEHLVLEADESELIEGIQKAHTEGKIIRFLEYIQAYSNNNQDRRISPQRSALLLNCLVRQWESFDIIDDNDFFSLPFSWRLLFCVQPLLRLLDVQCRLEMMQSLFVDREISISTLFILLRDFQIQHNRFVDEEKQRWEEPDISLEQLHILEGIFEQRMSGEFDAGTVFNHDDALGLIWLFEQLNPTLANEKKQCISFDDVTVAKLVHVSVVHGKMAIKMVHKYWSVKKEDIEEFIDIRSAYTKIRTFVQTPEFFSMNQNVQQDIAAFLIEMERSDNQEHQDEYKIGLNAIETKLSEIKNSIM